MSKNVDSQIREIKSTNLGKNDLLPVSFHTNLKLSQLKSFLARFLARHFFF